MRRALDSSTLVRGPASTRSEKSCAALEISSIRCLIQPKRPSTAIAGNSHSKKSASLLGTLTGTPFFVSKRRDDALGQNAATRSRRSCSQGWSLEIERT